MKTEIYIPIEILEQRGTNKYDLCCRYHSYMERVLTMECQHSSHVTQVWNGLDKITHSLLSTHNVYPEQLKAVALIFLGNENGYIQNAGISILKHPEVIKTATRTKAEKLTLLDNLCRFIPIRDNSMNKTYPPPDWLTDSHTPIAYNLIQAMEAMLQWQIVIPEDRDMIVDKLSKLLTPAHAFALREAALDHDMVGTLVGAYYKDI